MSNPSGFETLFEKARETPEYWTELAVLEFTEDVISRMNGEDVNRAELARRVGCSPAYITKILRGSTNFTLESMVKISRALGCALRTHLQPERTQSVWFDLLDPAREHEAPFESSRQFISARGTFAPCEHRREPEREDETIALAS